MDHPYQPARAWRIAALLFFFMVINFMDKIAVGLLAVPMMSELHWSATQFGLLASSFFWLFPMAGVLGGFIADRHPTQRVLLAMAAIWTLCQLPMALSSSLAVLVFARVLLGIGEGPAFPVAVHACYKWFPDSRRNMPVALLSMGSAIGLLLAGVCVPLVSAHWGWRANFLVLAAFTVAWMLAWLVLGGEGPLDGHDGRQAPVVRLQARLPYRRLLADRTVLGCMLMRFVAYWGLALTLTWMPAYLQQGLGFDAVRAGRLYALIVLVTIPFMIGLPWYSQRLLARGVSSRVGRGLLSALTLVLGGALFALMPGEGISTPLRVALLAVGAGLVPVIYTLGPAMLAEVVPPAQRGAILAIDNSVASMAGALAPLVSGLLIERFEGARGYELGFATCGALMVVGGLLGGWLAKPERSMRTLMPPAAGV